MDLISIRRKYRNKRNTIIIAFLVTIFLLCVITIQEIRTIVIKERVYVSFEKQYEEAIIREQKMIQEKKAKEEAERKAKLPNLTQEGINNITNLYQSTEKRVFLTFDDGPSKNATIPILDILKQENIKASFFVLGSRVELYPNIVKRAYDENHYIANHGYSHIYSQIYASPQSVFDEYSKTLTAIQNALGTQEYNPHLFRFPGGYTGGRYAQIKQEASVLLEQNGIVKVDWNALTGDSAGNKTTEQFLQEIDKTANGKNTVVVLMHDAGDKLATVEALPQIIAYFRDRGYAFENFYSVIK